MNPIGKTSEVVQKHRKLWFFVGFVVICSIAVFVSGFIQALSTRTSSRAAGENVIEQTSIASGSAVVKSAGITRISLSARAGYLYKTGGSGITAASEFISNNPTVDTQATGQSINPRVKGEAVTTKPLLPVDFLQNATLTRSVDDSANMILEKEGISLNNQHYYYSQLLDDIPVFNAQLAIHVKNGNEVYALDGALVEETPISAQAVSVDSARENAFAQAKKDASSSANMQLIEVKEYIFNKSLLGISDDSKNYRALRVVVADRKQFPTFLAEYFVDLGSGAILYSRQLLTEALERAIFDGRDCTEENCPIKRIEGGPPIADQDVNNTYDYLGDTYNFFHTLFNRDSYNNTGGIIPAFVHFPTSDNFPCPNAAWLLGINFMVICDGMVAKDILAHELTHGMSGASANFFMESQSGSLAESVSDIFAAGVEPNWSIGEGSSVGVIRRLDDPTQTPLRPHPDKLFSQNYYCAPSGQVCDPFTNDSCGIHRNSTVTSKAFFLLTEGGSFNGCSMTGIGREKAFQVAYRALTVYLTPLSNFKSFYTAMLNSCADLYGQSSDTCTQVQKAMQATELDQQPDFEQIGAKCLGIQEQTPACAGDSLLPTPVPTDGLTTIIPTHPDFTPVPTMPVITPTPITIGPTPTFVPGGSIVDITVRLDGIGVSENHSPKHQMRAFEVSAHDISSHETLARGTGLVTYDTNSGSFTGKVGLGVLPSGSYLLKITLPGALRKQFVDPVHIAQGGSTIPVQLVVKIGDTNHDNKHNIVDYNILLSCLGSNSSHCPVASEQVDLNDDGRIDGVDFNLLLRSFASREGD